MQVGIHIFYFLVKELSLMYDPHKNKEITKTKRTITLFNMKILSRRTK